jgi:hypothetical protein
MGTVNAPKPIRSGRRLVDGTLEVLEASLEAHGWCLRVIRGGRVAHSTRMSKWQQVERALQIFASGAASDVPGGGPTRAVSA